MSREVELLCQLAVERKLLLWIVRLGDHSRGYNSPEAEWARSDKMFLDHIRHVGDFKLPESKVVLWRGAVPKALVCIGLGCREDWRPVHESSTLSPRPTTLTLSLTP